MGETVGVVACSKGKASKPTRADTLYTGRTFRAASSLLRALGADRLVILSAEYGPVEGATVLAPYERSLVGARRSEVRAWTAAAAPRLRAMVGDARVLAIVPADYAGALQELPRVERLFPGLSQGRLYSRLASELHQLQLLPSKSGELRF